MPEKLSLENDSNVISKTLTFTKADLVKHEFNITTETEQLNYKVILDYLKTAKLLDESDNPIAEIHGSEHKQHNISFNLDYFNHKLKYTNAYLKFPSLGIFGNTYNLNLSTINDGETNFVWKKKGLMTTKFLLIDESNPEFVIAEFKRNFEFRAVGHLKLNQLLDKSDMAVVVLSASYIIYMMILSERNAANFW